MSRPLAEIGLYESHIIPPLSLALEIPGIKVNWCFREAPRQLSHRRFAQTAFSVA